MVRTLALALALASSTAAAVPIRYTIEGTGGGWADGWSFFDTAYRIELTADTDSWDGERVTADLAVITIDGVFAGKFTDPYALRYVGGRVEFEGWWFGGDQVAFDATVPAFLAGFAPVAGTDVAATLWTQMTDHGLVELTSSGDVAFSAAMIPEPGTWALLLAGLSLLGARRATHRRSRATPRTHHRPASALP